MTSKAQQNAWQTEVQIELSRKQKSTLVEVRYVLLVLPYYHVDLKIRCFPLEYNYLEKKKNETVKTIKQNALASLENEEEI